MKQVILETDIGFSHKKEKIKISILTNMKKIRLLEEGISNRYAEGNMRCPTHLSIGQEAVATGVCSSLTKKILH